MSSSIPRIDVRSLSEYPFEFIEGIRMDLEQTRY